MFFSLFFLPPHPLIPAFGSTKLKSLLSPTEGKRKEDPYEMDQLVDWNCARGPWREWRAVDREWKVPAEKPMARPAGSGSSQTCSALLIISSQLGAWHLPELASDKTGRWREAGLQHPLSYFPPHFEVPSPRFPVLSPCPKSVGLPHHNTIHLPLSNFSRTLDALSHLCTQVSMVGHGWKLSTLEWLCGCQ